MATTLWECRLFGGLNIRCGERIETRFRTQKTAALLAYLALYSHRAHPREELAVRFWEEGSDEEGRQSLRVALNSLRRQLEAPSAEEGELIVADRATIGLRREAFISDVAHFEKLLTKAARLARSQPDNPDERLTLLRQAIGLYSGPLLPGFYDDWILTERERLHTRFLDALQETEKLLRWMRRGDEADAIALRYTQSESSDGVGKMGEVALASVDKFASLPNFFTRFFGRERDIERLVALLNDTALRMITLLGPGGIGKTRLSVEAVRAWGQEAIWIPLATVVRGEDIADALRQALKLPSASGATGSEWEQVTTHLRELAATGTLPLLVLDNFEQVEEESGARFLARLLRSVPGVRCLVSSRRRLAVPGEHLVAVEPLCLPDETVSDPAILRSNPSVALFVDRARSVVPDFAVTARNAESITHLSRLLDGLPLAIELAAAWASAFNPVQMAQKLAAQGERFALLAARKHADRVERHRSLWNAIAWSYELLPPDLRKLWRLLSVFQGGFTADMAETVADDVFSAEGLACLRERSLLRFMEPAEGDDPDEPRYELLESLREFAAERVCDEEAPDEQCLLRLRHLQTLEKMVQAEAAYGYGPKTGRFILRYKRELPNIRLALNHSEAGQVPISDGVRLACRLSRLWRTGYMREGQRYLEALLSRAQAEGEIVAPDVHAKSLMEIGVLYRMCGELAAAEPPMVGALDIYESENNRNGVFACRQSLGTLALIRGKYGEAKQLLTQAMELAKQIGNKHGVATCLNNLGYVADGHGDYGAMRRFHEEELEVRREIGEETGIALALCGMAVATRGCGEHDQSETYFHESFRVFHAVSDLYGLLPTFWLYAELLVDKQEWERASILYGVGTEWNRKLGILIDESTQNHVNGYLDQCRDALGQTAFDAMFHQGAAMEIDTAVRFAVCEV